MTREEALGLLRSTADISYTVLGDIFHSFGFIADSPNFVTEVYYHPSFKREIAPFSARDCGHGIISDDQRVIVLHRVKRLMDLEGSADPGATAVSNKNRG